MGFILPLPHTLCSWHTHLPKGQTTKKLLRRDPARDSIICALLNRRIDLEAGRIHAHEIAGEIIEYHVHQINVSVESDYQRIQRAENQGEDNGQIISGSNRGIMHEDRDATILGGQVQSSRTNRHFLKLSIDQTQIYSGTTPFKRKISDVECLLLRDATKRQRSSASQQNQEICQHSQYMDSQRGIPTSQDNSRESKANFNHHLPH
jgi:hypothetical protein